MANERNPVSAALMHLFYQQGLFSEDGNSEQFPEELAMPTPSQPLSPKAGMPMTPEEWQRLKAGSSSSEQAAEEGSEVRAATNATSAVAGNGATAVTSTAAATSTPTTTVASVTIPTTTVATSAVTSNSTSSSSESSGIRALRARRAELVAKLQAGALQAENEALEGKVLKMQEDILTLQTEFKEMKDKFSERLDHLRLALEEQQAAAANADRRVVCTEDLIRFHEEQRRLMAGHWKLQCQKKDERIRWLNLQLTEYTVDWQRLGVQKQTEASLSHELYCLEDRHRKVIDIVESYSSEAEQLKAQLAKAKSEEEELAKAEAEAKASMSVKLSDSSRQLLESEALRDGLQKQLELRATLQKDHRSKQEDSAAEKPVEQTLKQHTCIWRDELDVRECQLQKITSQTEKTNIALHNAQVALASQRARHEEMKTRHSEAESRLREGERQRVQRQRRCQELRRVESHLTRLMEATLAQEAKTEGSVASNASSATLTQSNTI
eukprot:TRINITY_DN112459_c0_g1_i1.p1 TRINITY_DN112459_c0_g1~~TRINITY_DN112459_c0_g1_i1.p1  ORF type:complete len:524 (+),score=132.17 TRINITY_DN112459_c0_g1_i1:87-1574(+)